MKSRLQNAFIFAALILCAVPAFGQTEAELEDKYGKPVKVYALGSTIWISAEYASDGQTCEMVLFPKPTYGNAVYLRGELSFIELEKALNEIVPQTERGKRGDLWGFSITAAGVESRIYEYEKVTIFVKAKAGFTSRQEPEKIPAEENEKNGDREGVEELADPIFRNAEIVIISWKERKCHEQTPARISKAAERVALDTVELPIELTTLEPYEDFTRFAATDTQGLCAVHHQPLKKTIVPIHYGHIIDFKEIGRKEFFPNATDWFGGGCLISPNSKYQALVLQCARCLEERETRWLQFVKRIESKTKGSQK